MERLWYYWNNKKTIFKAGGSCVYIVISIINKSILTLIVIYLFINMSPQILFYHPFLWNFYDKKIQFNKVSQKRILEYIYKKWNYFSIPFSQNLSLCNPKNFTFLREYTSLYYLYFYIRNNAFGWKSERARLKWWLWFKNFLKTRRAANINIKCIDTI